MTVYTSMFIIGNNCCRYVSSGNSGCSVSVKQLSR